MVATEGDLESKATFLLAWLLLNFFWLALLRRPAIAALVSLAMVATLILLSQFKYDKLMMTVNFVDVMILDTDTVAFFLTIYPDLLRRVILAALVAIPALGLLWWLDPYRVRLRVASAGGTLCLAAAVGISIAGPMDPYEAFSGDGYVSKFVNSGVDAIVGLHDARLHGIRRRRHRQIPPRGRGRLQAGRQAAAHHPDPRRVELRHPQGARHQGARAATAGISIPSTARSDRSSWKRAGGPTWFAEYSVLTGLSARSFGRFAYFVTRIAAGRVERGLPHMLQRCGYRTFTLYPARGAFMSARSFQTTTGVAAVLRQQGHGRQRRRARLVFLRPGRAGDRARAQERAAVYLLLSRRQSFPLGLHLSSGSDAGLAQARQRAQHR